MRKFGSEVEEKALEIISAKQCCNVLRKNYRTKSGEIDLVFEQIKDDRVELVILEVRCRREGSFVDAIESVDFIKRRRIESATRAFLLEYEGPATELRFDILAWDGYSWIHLENAW